MKVTENVQNVIVGGDNNVYLITGEERAVLFDSGHETDESVDSVLGLWDGAGRPEVAAIIVSHHHGDHSGGAARLAKATGAPVVSSLVEKEPIEDAVPGTRVTTTVTGGEVLDLGGATIEYIFTPGHTFGSLCAYYREQRFLFAGDTIRNNGQVVAVNPKVGELSLYLGSLRKLLDHDIRMIGPGHGQEVDDPRAHIESELARLSSDLSSTTSS